MVSKAETTVLVVDDDPDLREIMGEVLESEGYAVETARHGRDALDRLEHIRPHVIVLDLMMPEMGGEEFLEHFERTEFAARIPVLVLTAARAPRAKSWQPCVREIVHKPVDMWLLLSAVQRAIEPA